MHYYAFHYLLFRKLSLKSKCIFFQHKKFIYLDLCIKNHATYFSRKILLSFVYLTDLCSEGMQRDPETFKTLIDLTNKQFFQRYNNVVIVLNVINK